MKYINIMLRVSLGIFATFLLINTAQAAPAIRSASGANAAAIQAEVDQFRADLGALNPNNGQSFTNGRREINWDGVPDNFSDPNIFPNDFFNVNSPRGAVFNAFDLGGSTNRFLVSADSSNPTNTAVRFSSIDPSYLNLFQTFSPQRLFMMQNGTLMETVFFIPGTKIPATVNGFGVIFTDVDSTQNASVKFFAPDGSQLLALDAPAASNGLSFVGASFNDGTRIARVVIESGKNKIAAGNVDGTNGIDVTVMDDFIYGEPRAAQYHAADFDGDGTSDFSVFRPDTGTWFYINSGNTTFTSVNFGQYGDIPIDGDFDGDSRTDFTVFRPSTGTWFRSSSSVGGFQVNQFGVNGDKPVAGDYDKDGKTDIAVWRPSTGTYFFIGSKDESFRVSNFGVSGDIPLLAGAQ